MNIEQTTDALVNWMSGSGFGSKGLHGDSELKLDEDSNDELTKPVVVSGLAPPDLVDGAQKLASPPTDCFDNANYQNPIFPGTACQSLGPDCLVWRPEVTPGQLEEIFRMCPDTFNVSCDYTPPPTEVTADEAPPPTEVTADENALKRGITNAKRLQISGGGTKYEMMLQKVREGRQ